MSSLAFATCGGPSEGHQRPLSETTRFQRARCPTSPVSKARGARAPWSVRGSRQIRRSCRLRAPSRSAAVACAARGLRTRWAAGRPQRPPLRQRRALEGGGRHSGHGGPGRVRAGRNEWRRGRPGRPCLFMFGGGSPSRGITPAPDPTRSHAAPASHTTSPARSPGPARPPPDCRASCAAPRR